MHETSFKSLGINFEHVSRTDEAFTGVAQILVEETGQNSIVIVPGANDKLGAENVRKAVALIKEACVVVAQLEVNIEASVEALKLAFTNEVKIIFNAAPAASNLPSEVYQLSSVFCVNESEAEMLTGEKVDSIESADRSAQILQERGCKVVLITLGSRGAYLKDEANNGILIAAPPVKAVDTTGAGDSFIGALAYYMAYYPKLPLQTMVERSCQVAAFSVQKPGTQISFPTKEELPEELFL